MEDTLLVYDVNGWVGHKEHQFKAVIRSIKEGQEEGVETVVKCE